MRQAVRAIVIKDDALLVMHRNKFGNEYYTLVGGGIDSGETPEQALHREVMEETSLVVANPRLVFVETNDSINGDQYIFLVDYQSGEVALSPDTEEAKINQLGQNMYTPLWLPIAQLPDVPFLSETLKSHLLTGLHEGWPQTTVHFKHIEV